MILCEVHLETEENSYVKEVKGDSVAVIFEKLLASIPEEVEYWDNFLVKGLDKNQTQEFQKKFHERAM